MILNNENSMKDEDLYDMYYMYVDEYLHYLFSEIIQDEENVDIESISDEIMENLPSYYCRLNECNIKKNELMEYVNTEYKNKYIQYLW